MPLCIKNWDSFQHYKHRCPPWIKVYRSLLNDRQWHDLPSETTKALMQFWLIAAEKDGELPPVSDLAFRLRVSEKEIEQHISRLSHFLTHGASTVLAPCKQDATPETEAETETETEAETEAEARGVKLPFPSVEFKSAWSAWKEHRRRLRKPMTDRAQELILKKLPSDEAVAIAWINNAIEKGWQGIYEPKPDQPPNRTPVRPIADHSKGF